MLHRNWLLELIIGLSMIVALQTVGFASASQATLVDGVLARAQAVISGRISYTVRAFPVDAGDKADATRIDFVFSGPSWRMDYPAIKIERINHRGEFVEVSRPKPNGTARTNATLDTDRSLTRDLPYPPFFAGSLWFASTGDYVQKHKGDAKVKGTAEVSAIKCTILEWAVSGKDKFSAFSQIVPSLRDGGVLRLYVSPDLGHVLPRVEYVTPNGEVAERFDASDFKDAGSGVHFPMKMRDETFPGKGKTGYVIDYDIASVDGINEPVPEEAFVAKLPAGTDVQDLRKGQAVGFVVGELPAEIGTVARVQSGKTLKRRWVPAVVYGSLLGGMVVLVVFVLKRTKRG